MKNREKALLVLGMHRSGTSSVAGVLCKLGGSAPRTLYGAPDNPKGHWESEPIFQLNDRILESFGSSWADWRSVPNSFAASKDARTFNTEAIATFKSEYGDGALPVIKDPRICRLMPFWKNVLDALKLDVHIVLPLRAPLESARSLEVRNGIPIVAGVHIWLRHVLDAESASRGMPRTIFTWSEFLEDWRKIATRIASDAGIVWPIPPEQAGAEIDDFLTKDLRHHATEREDHPHVHAWATAAYDAMIGLSKGEQPELHEKLDRIRSAMEETSDLIGHFYSEYKEINRLKATERELTKAADTYKATIVNYQSLTDQYTKEIEQHWRVRSEIETEKTKLYETTTTLTETVKNYEKSLKNYEILTDRYNKEIAEHWLARTELVKEKSNLDGTLIGINDSIKNYKQSINDYKILTDRYAREIEEHWSIRSELETKKNELLQTIKSLEDSQKNDDLLLQEYKQKLERQENEMYLINKYLDKINVDEEKIKR